MPTKAQLREAERQKQQKIQLEQTLAIALLRFINLVGRAAVNLYIDTGQILSVNDFSSELKQILFNSYLKTQRIFSKDQLRVLSRQLKQDIGADEASKLFAIFRAEASNKAGIQSSQLIKTMQGQLNQTFFAAISAFDTAAKIAKAAVANWKEVTKSRVDPTIVNTQVQGTAEDAKNQTVSFVISGSIAITPVVSAGKIWITVGDDRVRPAHAEANGQVVRVTERYLVGGERLAYPGDLAGSPENIINCRCSSLTFIQR